MLINSKIILIIIIIFIIIAIIIPIKFNKNEYEESKIFIFFTILAGLAIFLTFINTYNMFEIQYIDQKIKLVEELRLLKNSIINDIFKEIDNSINIIPDFIKSITPLQKYEISNTNINYKINNSDIRIFTLSFRIFTLWEDFILSKQILNYDSNNYIIFFLQFANSKLLYEQWVIQKNNFNKESQKFGDILFEYGLSIKNQNIEEYIKNSLKLLKNNKF